jgi:hypothetical protein
MNARELGRQAALLHLKLAAVNPATISSSSSLSTTPSAGAKPTTGGASSATTFGAKPVQNASIGPIVPKVAPTTSAPTAPTPVATAPTTTQATAIRPGAPVASAPAGGGIGGMLGGMFSGMKSPTGMANLLTSGPVKPFTEAALGMGGMPLFAAAADFGRSGGANLQNILKGRVT